MCFALLRVSERPIIGPKIRPLPNSHKKYDDFENFDFFVCYARKSKMECFKPHNAKEEACKTEGMGARDKSARLI